MKNAGSWASWQSCSICGTVGHADVECNFGGEPRLEEGASSSDLMDAAGRESEVSTVPKSSDSLRFGSVNVHSLHQPHHIAQLLQPHAPFDVLAIQEAPRSRRENLHEFASLLNMQVCVVRTAAHSLENAILIPRSSAQMKAFAAGLTCHSGFQTAQTELSPLAGDAGARVEPSSQGGGGQLVAGTGWRVHGWDLTTDMELRTAVAVELPCGLVVCCTHLDAYKETARVRQVETLLPRLSAVADGKGMLILGDFNAVRRADYSVRGWDALVERRARHGIRTDTAVTTRLEGEWGLYDCRAEARLAEGRVVTSRFEVRVDYAWADAAALAEWMVQRVAHVDLQGTTDHSLVICDLSPRATAG